jgi:hypothetical protein
MATDLKHKEVYFTELLGLENGIPSHDTFSVSVTDPAEFLACFIQWAVELTRAKGKLDTHQEHDQGHARIERRTYCFGTIRF